MTFPAGLSSLVEACLQDDLAGVTTRHADDSALLLSSRSPGETIAGLPYLKNTFEVILEVPRTSLDAAARAIAKRVQGTAPKSLGVMRSFRLMAQVDGQLSPLDRRAKETLERAIKTKTGASVNARGGSGDEVWVIGRRELPQFILARRLSKGKKMPAAGSLGTELSHLLVRMSNPAGDDTFLDPFCGSGALVRARATWPVRRILCADLYADPELHGVDVEYLREDALELPSVPTGSVDAIVSDPPWGEHEDLGADDDRFYVAMAGSFARLLDPQQGRLVLLVARRLEETVSGALSRCGFSITGRVPLLVNGHPASAVTAQRSSERDTRG